MRTHYAYTNSLTLLTLLAIMLTVDVLIWIKYMSRFGSYETPKMPTIPTFLQYIKTAHKKGIEGKTKFDVELIWLPGKFDNVTLQTHAFRYIASPDNQLYKDLIDYADEIQDLEKQELNKLPRLEIIITSFENKTIDLVENPKVLVVWELMGANALKAKSS